MHTMKRVLATTLAPAMTLSLLLAACGGAGDGGAPAGGQTAAETTAERQPEQVNLKFWKAGNDVAWHDYWLQTIEEYEAANPHVTIEFSEAPWGQEIDTKLNAGFASGTGPDLIMHSIGSIGQRASLGQYEPLDSFIDGWADKDDMLDIVFSVGSYKEKHYGINLYPVPALLAYRKDFFREAGLDPEKPPATWEELADYAVKLTQRDGNIVTRSGLTISNNGIKLLVPFSIQAGAEPVTDKAEGSMNNPYMIEALAFLTDLFKDKKVSMELTEADENKQSLFSQGKAAMSVVQPSWIEQLIKTDPDLKEQIGFINLSRKKSAVWAGAEMLFISSESQLKEEAWAFIEFVMGEEQMMKRYKATKAPIVRESMYEAYIADDPFMNEAIMNGVKVGSGAPKVTWASLWLDKYLRQAIQEAYYGKKSPEEALTDAEEGLLKEIAQIEATKK